uniref:Uncharacterized protein n=1 Tax=Rhizophora mucronata TaxID=61149 RepID=A0A2P2PUB7_RHIMU
MVKLAMSVMQCQGYTSFQNQCVFFDE